MPLWVNPQPMVTRGERFTHTLPATRLLALLAVAIPGSAVLVLLLNGGTAGGQLARVMAAAFATWLVIGAWRSASGRVRSTRGWIALALAVWLISEIARLASGQAISSTPFTIVSLAALGVCAGAAIFTAIHARLSRVDETVFYLDAAAIFFALLAGLLVAGSGRSAADPTIQFHAAFFVGVLAATLFLFVSIRVPLRFVGAWECLVGVGVVALGYVGLLTPAGSVAPGELFHAAVAAGVLLAGHGAAGWSDEEARSTTYARIAAMVRAVLPIAVSVLAVIVAVALIASPGIVADGVRATIAASLGVVVIAVVARQTLLLIDRERVLDRERRLSDELTVAEAQFRSVVERVPGVVYVAEAGQHGRWHFVSAQIEDLLGYSAADWTADPTLWMQRMHPADRDRMMLAESQDADRAEQQGRWEYRLIARDGRVVWVIDDEAVISRDADGHATMVQGILVDISDRKDLEDQLRHQALHDPLTALPNRVLFIDRLSHALVRRSHGPGGLAVLFVDLDEFKDINDSLGHAAGDELLHMVGERLSTVIRAEDTVGRLGGDEFAFLLEESSPDQAIGAANRILAALAKPFELGSRTVTLTASIGIATMAHLADGRSAIATADALLRDADTAMYAAKSLGNGRVKLFDRRMDEPISRRRDLRAALERALTEGGLVVEYQPIVDLATGVTRGLEALVRWDHPQLGRLLPADFIPLAEESGLIGPLGDWVLHRACEDLAGREVLVSVNISAHQLGRGDLPGRVAHALAETGLPARHLILELTESTLASAGHGAETELEEIQALGVQIALDDFGSGYSSLEYLGRLPIDVLKIDRSLVERVHVEPQRQEVLRAISHIAERLHLHPIVEGVEHEAQRVTLLELGFRQAQGFLFSPAVPLADALGVFQVRRAS